VMAEEVRGVPEPSEIGAWEVPAVRTANDSDIRIPSPVIRLLFAQG
jgi:hypothetical protein